MLRQHRLQTEDTKQEWILVGYELFAKEGPKGLKVEVIARKVGKSKSSFYHYFADMEVFTELLLHYHIEQAKIIGQKERMCKNVVPELLLLLVEIKQDLLFNRQLRIHRNIPAFKDCFEKVNREIGEAIIGIWAEMLGIPTQESLANLVLGLTMENFYLQITEETLNYDWLLNYVQEIRLMVQGFKNNGK
ncbi:MAG: hypothetical protein OHK0057_31250 [Thermoflexibacter sp.]